MARLSPGWIVKLMLSTALRPPKSFIRFSITKQGKDSLFSILSITAIGLLSFPKVPQFLTRGRGEG
jgi:hypothetical protein